MINFPENITYALTRLHQAGFDAYCVGGCVRDILLGAEPNDWDITTSALPEETITAFAGHPVIPTGLRHGTVTVLIGGEPLEITTFRIDGDYSDNRRPDNVQFTRSLREDLARRDFTINALAIDTDGEIIDFYGGNSDIEKQIVRCVGDPSARFKEDALRILRALRFASVLGFSIDEDTYKAIVEEVWRLENISAERINAELTKMLSGKNAGGILRQYHQPLTVVLPEIVPMFGFDQCNRHHNLDVWQHTVAVIENSPPEPILRWAALLHDIGKPHTFSLDANGEGHFFGHAKKSCEIADAIMLRLKFDNFSRERILKLVAHHDTPLEQGKALIKRKLNRLGADVLSQLIALQRADSFGQAGEYRHRQEHLNQIEAAMQEIIRENECFSLRDLTVDGNDIMKLGFNGKEVGEALNFLLEAVMDGKLPNERGVLLALLEEMDVK